MYRQQWAKGKSKYGNNSQEYGGRRYDSKGEANYAAQLEWRKKAGEIKEIIPQYKVELRVNGKLICNYKVDFKLIMADDSVEFHEYKGLELPLWQIKWKLMEALIDEIEPGAEMVVIKHR